MRRLTWLSQLRVGLRAPLVNAAVGLVFIPAAFSQNAAPALTAKEKLELRTLEQVMAEAEQSEKGSEQRTKTMTEFLDRSAPMVHSHPELTSLWLWRAALELNRLYEAWEAGQQLQKAGALDSNDEEMLNVMAALNRKGLLEEKLGAKLKAQAEFLDSIKGKNFANVIGLELVWLPAGYWVGKYEVTQAEYEAIMGSNPGEFRGARRPVENVDWNDAVEFCQRLTEKEREAGKLPEGWAYRLPTEKQWEYFVGDARLEDAVHNQWTTDDQGIRKPLGTKPVGSLPANRFGLHDVRGNVWEWCLDWYDSKKEKKVLRGASWDNVGAESLAVSFRLKGTPDGRRNRGGFRVVLVGGSSSSE